jgi:hypothetical protein
MYEAKELAWQEELKQRAEETQLLMRQKQEEYQMAKETFPWIEELKEELKNEIEMDLRYKLEDWLDTRLREQHYSY